MDSMIQLTDKQWALYEERYGKLMHTISMKISGDDAVASHEDNYADLCIAALESIEGFEKKTGEKFDEAIDNKLFDQYTKTVLWNRKAKKGIPLTKKMDFKNRHLSIDAPSLTEEDMNLRDKIPDSRYNFDVSSIDLEDFTKNQHKDVQKIINAIIKNPDILSKEGIFNHAAIRKDTGLSTHFTRKAIERLQNSLRKSYEV